MLPCSRTDMLPRSFSLESISILILQARFACLRCAACGHFVSAESPCVRLELLNLAYFGNLLVYKYCKLKLINDFSYTVDSA